MDGLGHWNLFVKKGFSRMLSQVLQEKNVGLCGRHYKDNILRVSQMSKFSKDTKKQEEFKDLTVSLLYPKQDFVCFRPLFNQSIGNFHK